MRCTLDAERTPEHGAFIDAFYHCPYRPKRSAHVRGGQQFGTSGIESSLTHQVNDTR